MKHKFVMPMVRQKKRGRGEEEMVRFTTTIHYGYIV